MVPAFGMATYGREPLGPQVAEAAALGFDYVELDLTGPPTLDHAILGALEGPLPLPPRTAHLPELAQGRDLARARALVEALLPRGVQVFNLHLPGTPGLGPGQRQVDLLMELVGWVGPRGATVTVENTWEDPEAMAAVLDLVEGLGFCLDLGHANLFSPEYRGPAFLRRLGHRLRLVHVSDNLGGQGDLHLPVGHGRVPLAPTLALLASLGYAGPITLEVFRGGRGDRAESLARTRSAMGAGQTAG